MWILHFSAWHPLSACLHTSFWNLWMQWGKNFIQNYVLRIICIFVLQKLVKLFSDFFRLYFWVLSISWYANKKELYSRRHKIYHNCWIGTRKWKKSYMLLTLSMKYLHKNLPGRFFQGKKYFFFSRFPKENLQSVPV